MTPFNPCIIIPCYNHGDTLNQVFSQLVSLQLPIIIIDDGSNPETKKIIAGIIKQYPQTYLSTLKKNIGKGGAVMAGINVAYDHNFSHALQIDSDGQHNIQDAPTLLNIAQQHPNALVSGYPIYDSSIPKLRFYARYLTHVWVWIETLSLTIKDSMCGFRVYPVNPCISLFLKYKLGTRMNYDIEVLVRFFWDFGEIKFSPTKVIYPENGISHFQAFNDNMLISKMHAVLFFGMLLRLPKLLLRKLGR